MEENNNLKLWKAVEETDPNHTKKANVKGNKITSIAPQYQIKLATEQFGSYGHCWGFKELKYDYTLSNIGMIVLNAVFFYPKGEFPITNSVQLYRDGAMTKIDDDFAKKVETDTLTKALSKLGFNADIFMGRHDDTRYFNEMVEKYKTPEPLPKISEENFNKYLEAILKGSKNKKGELITIDYLKARHTLTAEQELELTND